MLKKRLEYIDYIKFIGMLLVIIGHINYHNPMKSWIYAFHMPLFFFIYGYTRRLEDFSSKSIVLFIKRKFITIIIPYFLWAFLYSGISTRTIIGIVYGSHNTLKDVSNSSLWFLPTYFISILFFELITLLINKVINKNEKIKLKIVMYAFISIILALIAIYIPNVNFGYFWGLNASLICTVFIILGCLFRYFFKDDKYIKNNKVLYVTTIIFFICTFLYKMNNIDYVLLAQNKIGNLLWFIFSALIGIFLVFNLGIIIYNSLKKKYIKEKMLFMGKNTLCMFASQKIIISFVEKIVLYLNLNVYIGIILITGVTVVVLYVLIKLINRYIPILNGKDKNDA